MMKLIVNKYFFVVHDVKKIYFFCALVKFNLKKLTLSPKIILFMYFN